MPSFRSASSQASFALRGATALGQSRHAAKKAKSADGKIFSLGTLRAYRQSLTVVARWYAGQAKAGRPGFTGQVSAITREQALEYLSVRSLAVGQKQLDQDRQSLEKVVGGRLGRVRSKAEKAERLANQPRAYSKEQVMEIARHQTVQHSVATQIAAAAGLRAHELFTLAPASEQPPDSRRRFRADRFTGRSDFTLYTVVGKGGLIREVAIPKGIAQQLEGMRRQEEHGVRDRGIWYRTLYFIGGGQAWSQSVTTASQEALGWSTGAHGLRHYYAQQRLEELQQGGFSWGDALEVVSQELGHFRQDVVLTYLR